MSKRLFPRPVSLLAVVCAIPSAFAASQPKEQLQLQKEGIELMGQVAEAARDIRYNADRLNSFNRSMTVSRWTHYHHLTEMRSLVNDGLQPAFQRLQEMQPQLPEWKQQSIDAMLESAKVLAADMNSAILSKNDAGTVPPAMNAEYKDLVTKIFQHADTLLKTTDAARSFASAKLKEAESGQPQK